MLAEEGRTFYHDDVYDMNIKNISLLMPDGSTYETPADFVLDLVDDLDRIAWSKTDAAIHLMAG